MARTGDAWSSTQVPSMVGTRAVVTGANGGLGFRTAAALAQHGADVTLACRDLDRGQDAADRIRATVPTATLEATPLDLADLASVRAFAGRWTGPLDLLVNNAGVTARRHHRTADGFERQLGTNHLGHFALTGLLLPALRAAADARVVVVSSLGHKLGRIDLDDLQREHRFRFLPAYGQSKLANLLFVRELDRRLRAAGDPIIVAAHPGIAATNLPQCRDAGAVRRHPHVVPAPAACARRAHRGDQGLAGAPAPLRWGRTSAANRSTISR